MLCPVCKDVVLQMADRQGIEIDYCPKCRGVWLDRGELDKIIERTAAAEGGEPEADPRGVPGADRPARGPEVGAPHGSRPPAAPRPMMPQPPQQPYPPQPYPQQPYGQPPRKPDDSGWGYQHQPGYPRKPDDSGYGYQTPYGHKYKKKSTARKILGEIFDF